MKNKHFFWFFVVSSPIIYTMCRMVDTWQMHFYCSTLANLPLEMDKVMRIYWEVINRLCM